MLDWKLAKNYKLRSLLLLIGLSSPEMADLFGGGGGSGVLLKTHAI